MVAPSAMTETKCPAGTVKCTPSPRIVAFSATAAPVVLTSTRNVVTVTVSAPPSSTSTDAESDPARPVGVTRKNPEPLLTVTKVVEPTPSVMPTLVADTRTTAEPSASVVRSAVNAPVNSCPAMVTVAGVAAVPTDTRRYCADGLVVSTCSEIVEPVWNARPGMLVTTLPPLTSPTTPALDTVRVRLVMVTWKAGVEPVPTDSRTFPATKDTVGSSPPTTASSSSVSAMSVLPSTDSVGLLAVTLTAVADPVVSMESVNVPPKVSASPKSGPVTVAFVTVPTKPRSETVNAPVALARPRTRRTPASSWKPTDVPATVTVVPDLVRRS